MAMAKTSMANMIIVEPIPTSSWPISVSRTFSMKTSYGDAAYFSSSTFLLTKSVKMDTRMFVIEKRIMAEVFLFDHFSFIALLLVLSDDVVVAD